MDGSSIMLSEKQQTQKNIYHVTPSTQGTKQVKLELECNTLVNWLLSARREEIRGMLKIFYFLTWS